MNNNNQHITIELENSLYNHELILYYQPQFNLQTLKYDGVEALLRWQHPKRGLVLPGSFIRTVEKSDLIIHLGKWILKTACEQGKKWESKGFLPMRIAINICEKQLREKNFVAFITHLLEELELTPAHLELEILENTIIHQDDKHIIDAIWRLKDLGVLISLDDFSVSHAKLDYLMHLPIDRIKLDKEFINDLHDPYNLALLGAIIEFANSLNIQVLAEGVESLTQLDLVTTHQCNMVQGFYFSQPLPVASLENFLMRNSS